MKIKDLKGLPFEIKDVDTEKRKVKAYFSIFDNVDLDGDIVRPSAFSKTFKERGPGGADLIAHMKNHYSAQTPGRILELGTDEKGAWFVSQLSKTTLGNDTLIEYQEGIIKQHSFGFDIIQWKKNEDLKAYELIELKLYEVSSLNFLGANPETSVLSISKSIKDEFDAIKTFELIEKYLSNGKFSDEILQKAEKLSIAITAAIGRPQTTEPDNTTQKDAPAGIDWQKVFSNL
jgi:HK97 family phage prohead protease